MEKIQSSRNDAVKSVRTIVLSTVSVFLVWYLALPSLLHDLTQRSLAEDLLAWLSLTEMLDRPHPNIDAQFASVISIPWLSGSSYYLTLAKIGATHEDMKAEIPDYGRLIGTEIYQINTTRQVSNPLLAVPYSAYIIRNNLWSRRGGVPLVVAERPCEPPPGWGGWAYTAEPCRPLALSDAEPRYWRRTQAVLEARSEKPQRLEDLKSNSPLVSKYILEFMSPSHSILGITLSSGLFFSCIGIIVGGLSLAMIPLLSVFPHVSKAEADYWIFLYDRQGPIGRITEVVLLAVTGCWALIPLYALRLQMQGMRRLDIELHDLESLVFNVGATFAVVGFIVNAALVYRLSLNRRVFRATEQVGSQTGNP